MSTVSDSKERAMIGCLRTRVHKQPIIALYFESGHTHLLSGATYITRTQNLAATDKMYHIKSATQTVIIITVEINPKKIVSISWNNGKPVIETK